jgi:hypothetical protein
LILCKNQCRIKACFHLNQQSEYFLSIIGGDVKYKNCFVYYFKDSGVNVLNVWK